MPEEVKRERKLKCELYNDSMQNWKSYAVPKAQLVICDIPFGIGNQFYGSSLSWWNNGRMEDGASAVAGKAAFTSDYNFNLAEFWHFAGRILKKEPKQGGAKGKIERRSLHDCVLQF